jgi:hypothetical protein
MVMRNGAILIDPGVSRGFPHCRSLGLISAELFSVCGGTADKY